jgi:ketosteroid isomerase-like protein
MEAIMSDFDSFMATRAEAAAAYVRGDAAPVCDLSSGQEPASFFGPDGRVIKGAQAVIGAYREGAARFGAEGRSRLEILQQGASGDVGYWAGLQHAVVEMDGKATPMTLRITELFRKENGQWKLVHRQADMMKD